MMDEDQSEIEGTLELAEVSQESRDILGAVLVAGVKAHQGIQQKKPGPKVLQRGPQALLVPLRVQAHDRLCDDGEVQLRDLQAAVAADGLQPGSHLSVAILCEVNERPAGGLDAEAVQCRSPRGDAHGEVKPEPALQRLRAASKEAHSLATPEALDEPAILSTLDLQVASEDARETFGLGGIHGQRTFLAEMTWLWSTVSAF
jgi:hypothetical protein